MKEKFLTLGKSLEGIDKFFGDEIGFDSLWKLLQSVRCRTLNFFALNGNNFDNVLEAQLSAIEFEMNSTLEDDVTSIQEKEAVLVTV